MLPFSTDRTQAALGFCYFPRFSLGKRTFPSVFLGKPWFLSCWVLKVLGFGVQGLGFGVEGLEYHGFYRAGL